MPSEIADSSEAQLDPEDVLGDSLQTLYDYAPITHSSAGSLFRYTLPARAPSAATPETTEQPAPDVITLETPTTHAGNWALHASSIWTAALFAAAHPEHLALEQHIALARQSGGAPVRVLELGAGAGLPSIVLAKTYTQDVHVTASDYPDAALVRALRENVARNGVAERCAVVPHAWGADAAPLLAGTARNGGADAGFDVVLAADTLWNPEAHALFLGTLRAVLRRTRGARVHLVAGLHTGRYTLQAFVRMLREYGFVLEEAVEWEVGGAGTRAWDVARAEGEEEKERRRWVVCMRVKWKDV
ncbi:hypothetical protein PsYK624_143090 [Phanerochaete sordida]|uniref:Nicotinamide N-methyltransferase n=1 Tax=Phanerochaete sordida TaxID=48140 RepID=A0A9P3GMH1_9APHY|nr:hypothetical protein PsYK624_143090 [Phanerochaete sordida]